MARRRPRPYVNLRAGGNDLPTMANFAAPGGPRITTFDARGRPVRETVTGNELDVLPQVRGLRIRRNVRTNYGVRDLVVDQQGNVLTAIRAGSNPRLMMSTPQAGQPRRLVVGRGPARAGAGAAPTGPGAGSTPAGPPDPYAEYNDYPFIKNYLSGLDRQYDSFQNYVTNTYNPAVTAASQALTQSRLGAGNAYNTAIQNYAGSAGTVASAITPAQVAGATGGSIVAPNQNALGAAQSMAASATAARGLDAAYRTSFGALDAEKMGQSFLSSTMGYAAGLLNQYGQKRQAERLKMDQWIAEQKAAEKEAKDKQDLEMLKLDQSMINSLIVSGDRAAARAVTQRGQDITAANNAADNAQQAANADWKNPNNLAKGNKWRQVQGKPGPKAVKAGNAVQATDGTWWVKNPGGSSGGGSSSGAPTESQRAARINDFRGKWKPGQVDPATGQAGAPVWGAGQSKVDAAAIFLRDNIALFPGIKKGNRTGVEEFLIRAGVTNKNERRRVIDALIQLIARG